MRESSKCINKCDYLKIVILVQYHVFICHYTYRSLDGDATECRLCKHCGCMLNTLDYIFYSEKIDPHADRRKEINFVQLKMCA